MDNSNIIISVIIVLCIAAGVTAYGISEGDNAVFNDLTGFSPDSTSSGDNGIGDLFGDNSNDGTIAIIKEYVSNYPNRIVLLDFPPTYGACQNFLCMLYIHLHI